jgi:hypothetical protein
MEMTIELTHNQAEMVRNALERRLNELELLIQNNHTKRANKISAKVIEHWEQNEIPAFRAALSQLPAWE